MRHLHERDVVLIVFGVRGYLHERDVVLIVFRVSIQSQHLQWLKFQLWGVRIIVVCIMCGHSVACRMVVNEVHTVIFQLLFFLGLSALFCMHSGFG
jgi:hypothetical protein